MSVLCEACYVFFVVLMMNIRTNHELRIEAYDSLISLKNNGVPRKAMIDKIKTELGIPRGTLYDWYKGKYRPHGRKGEIKHCQELFYVLGALLGDGCIYNWKTTQNYTILVGDRKFAVKYASMLRKCIGT